MTTFHPNKLRTQGWRVVYRLGNDRPQHVYFDSDLINIYHKTTSFSHGLRSRARNWAKQDLDQAEFGSSRIWV